MRQKKDMNFIGDIEPVQSTLNLLLPELSIQRNTSSSYHVSIVQGENLSVTIHSNSAEIVYGNRSMFARALSHLNAHYNEAGFHISETPRFTTLSLQLDATDGTHKLERLQWRMRKLALMGFTSITLYMEDTYELDNEPYFGYMRGRYTLAELRAIDDYADSLGIEIIPFIQTLGHFKHILKWPIYENVKNTAYTLLVDNKETSELLEKIFQTMRNAFRTSRIVIGFDEALDVTDAKYRAAHGDCDLAEVSFRHLNHVIEIANKYNFSAIACSDMFFSFAFDKYYEKERSWPQHILDLAPSNLTYGYWDYYTEDKETYDHMFKLHKQLGQTLFIGGIYNWMSTMPDFTKTLNATIPALYSAIDNNIENVIAATWGVDSEPTSILYGCQIYAEFCYTGTYNKDAINQRCIECLGVEADAFYNMTFFDNWPDDKVGLEVGTPGSPKRSQNLLYEDPLMPLFEKDFEDRTDLPEYFNNLQTQYENYATCYPEYKQTFEFTALLAELLKMRCTWRREAPLAIRSKNYNKARELATLAKEIEKTVNRYRNAYCDLWDTYLNPYGFEVYDIRLGGVAARFSTASDRMLAFANGTIDDIPELSSPKLPYSLNVPGAKDGLVRRQTWHHYSSVNMLVRPAFLP